MRIERWSRAGGVAGLACVAVATVAAAGEWRGAQCDGANVRMTFTGAAPEARLHARDNDPRASERDLGPLQPVVETGCLEFLDTGLLTDPAVTTRFYRVGGAHALAAMAEAETPALFMVQKQPRRADAWHLVGVPVRFDSAADACLSGELGRQLASGLVGGASESQSPRLFAWDRARNDWSWFWLETGGIWCVGPQPAVAQLESSQGLWIKLPPGGATTGPAVFAGPVHTNAAPVRFEPGRWTLFTWSLPTPRRAREGSGDDTGWGFLAQGAQPGRSWNDADAMYMENGDRAYHLYLSPSGQWLERFTTNAPDVKFVCGQGYHYYARGTGFVWRAGGVALPPGGGGGGGGGGSLGDSDGDGLPDAWEMLYFGNLAQTAGGDPDADGWTNREEWEAGTDPTRPNRFDAGGFLAATVFQPMF